MVGGEGGRGGLWGGLGRGAGERGPSVRYQRLSFGTPKTKSTVFDACIGRRRNDFSASWCTRIPCTHPSSSSCLPPFKNTSNIAAYRRAHPSPPATIVECWVFFVAKPHCDVFGFHPVCASNRWLSQVVQVKNGGWLEVVVNLPDDVQEVRTIRSGDKHVERILPVEKKEGGTLEEEVKEAAITLVPFQLGW